MFPFINNKSILKIIKNRKKLLKYKKDDIYTDWGKYNHENKYWYNNFKKIVSSTSDGLEEAEYFYNDKLKKIRTNISLKNDDVMVVCLVKNDLIRIKEFIKHYRKLGVKNFAFIDNCSSDGTFEYLLSEKSVDVFQIEEKYSTLRRQSWLNRIISFYGLNHWYLILDSDEFLAYNNCMKKNINDVVNYYSKRKSYRARALMVDMYPKNFMMSFDDQKFLSEFKYFDTDTYEVQKNKYFNNITGGMRKRIFSNKNSKLMIYLIKSPLIYFERDTVYYNSHYSYPFYKNFSKDLNIVLLHYKFMPKDLQKIKEIVESKNFADGSKEYKSYLSFYEENGNANITYKNSAILNEFSDVYKIDILSPIDWK